MAGSPLTASYNFYYTRYNSSSLESQYVKPDSKEKDGDKDSYTRFTLANLERIMLAAEAKKQSDSDDHLGKLDSKKKQLRQRVIPRVPGNSNQQVMTLGEIAVLSSSPDEDTFIISGRVSREVSDFQKALMPQHAKIE